ncbi:MAG: hypothetical protein ISQ08_02145 [Planctomycetes bacterium]|nr:hypothetical protein [Planctomycetota bacterium]
MNFAHPRAPRVRLWEASRGLVGLVLALVFLAPSVAAHAVRATREEPTDEQVRSAWERLPVEEQAEVAAWFRAECDRRGGYRLGLEQHVLFALAGGQRSYPAARENPLYEATRHAPAQPIQRRLLDPAAAEVRKERERMGLDLDGPEPRPRWHYDWARGEVVQSGDPFEPTHLVHLALAGRSPEHDLVVALVTAALDRAEQRPAHQAFGHAYATRTGVAYPGISLYDAWASGEELEMPDVECLGIYHDLTGEWKRFVAPVPGNQQRPLYTIIGDRFGRLRRERSVAEALARVYLAAEPPLDPSLAGNADRLHLFWERVSSDPAAAPERLPDLDEKPWKAWWESLDELRKDPDLSGRAAGRRMALRADRIAVRGRLVWVLQQWGAL